MAWTAPRTWVTGEIVTAALLNTHVRDNLLETASAAVTTAGDIVYADGANSLAVLPDGGGTASFLRSGVTAPAWSSTLLGPLTLGSASVTSGITIWEANQQIALHETDGPDAQDIWYIENNSAEFKVRFYDDSLATSHTAMRIDKDDFILHTGANGAGQGAVLVATDTTTGPTALTTTGANILDVTGVVTGGPAYVEGFWMVEIERTSAASVSTLSILPREDGNNLSAHFSYGTSLTAIVNDIIPGANDIHTFTGMWWRRVTATDTSDYELFISAGDNSRFQMNRGHMYVRSIQYPV